MKNVSRIVEELIHQQNILAMKDEPFADVLGISRPQWILIKTGKMEPGLTLLAGAAAAFPGLKDRVFDELQARGRERISA